VKANLQTTASASQPRRPSADTQGEMVLLSKTRGKIFLLLVLLLGGQDFQSILGLIGFGISVGNTDIQNTISATGPEATDKKITMIITMRGWERGSRRSRNQRSHGSTLNK